MKGVQEWAPFLFHHVFARRKAGGVSRATKQSQTIQGEVVGFRLA